MVTPGQQEGLKYLTSTPYNAVSSSPYGPTSAPFISNSGPYTSAPNQYSTPVPGSNMQLATSGAVAGYQVHQQFQQLQTVEETSWETPACSKGESRAVQERREENYQVKRIMVGVF